MIEKAHALRETLASLESVIVAATLCATDCAASGAGSGAAMSSTANAVVMLR